MAITIKEIQVSTKVTQQKKEPDLPLSRDLIQQIKEEIIREAKKDLSNLFLVEGVVKHEPKLIIEAYKSIEYKGGEKLVVSPSKSIRIAIS